MLVDGDRTWVEYSHIDYDEDDFTLLGDAYTAAGGAEMRAPLGAGEVRLLPMRELVDFAVGWIEANRPDDRSAPSS